MATETVYKCDYPGCGEELEYSGRGRPPKRCDEHKGIKKDDNDPPPRSRPRPSEAKSDNSPSSRPRPRAPRLDKYDKGPLDNPDSDAPSPDPDMRNLPPIGKGDKSARSKSENAASRTASMIEDVWPRDTTGKPMARIDFSCAELIPTGQYANVSIGPVRITTFVDLSRDFHDEYFNHSEKSALIQACNELAEIASRDIIGVQRNLVLESLQEDLRGKDGK